MFHWSTETCLKTPATRFFAVLRSARKQTFRDERRRMVELARISSISILDGKYATDLIEMYHRQAFDRPVSQDSGRPVLDSTDPATGKLLVQFFSGAAKGVTRG